jgi:hypothetical protein
LKRDLDAGTKSAGRAFPAMAGSGTEEWFPKTGSGGRLRHGTFTLAAICFTRGKFKANLMNADLSNNEARFRRKAGSPVACALAVAVFGLLSMLIVDHGPWNRPHVQAAEEAHYATTGAAARAAGAMVTPTMPKSALEPAPLVPKPIQPANPATP